MTEILFARRDEVIAVGVGEWKGAWEAGTYFINDIVEKDGRSWIVIVAQTTEEPSDEATEWDLFVDKGQQGDAGTNGTDGEGYLATSATSLLIGTGSKVFTTQAGLAYSAGARARASSAAGPTNWMEGLVTAYSATSLTIDVDLTNGAGTLADWNINLAGQRGAQGGQGDAGTPGTGNVNGAASSVDNTLPRFDGTGGKTLQTSGIVIDDDNNMANNGIQINAQTGTTYTIAASDNGKLITLTNGSGITLTVPQTSTTALPAGFQCAICQLGAGQVTVAKQGTDTIASKGSNLALAAQGSAATITKLTAGTPNAWLLVGDLD